MHLCQSSIGGAVSGIYCSWPGPIERLPSKVSSPHLPQMRHRPKISCDKSRHSSPNRPCSTQRTCGCAIGGEEGYYPLDNRGSASVTILSLPVSEAAAFNIPTSRSGQVACDAPSLWHALTYHTRLEHLLPRLASSLEQRPIAIPVLLKSTVILSVIYRYISSYIESHPILLTIDK